MKRLFLSYRKITSKGQVTIPKKYREQLGLLPHTKVEFEIVSNSLQIKKAEVAQLSSYKMIEHMKMHSGKVQMSTDEIMQLTRNE